MFGPADNVWWDRAEDHVPMKRSAARKLTLVADRRMTEAVRTAAGVRRYRLARLPVEIAGSTPKRP